MANLFNRPSKTYVTPMPIDPPDVVICEENPMNIIDVKGNMIGVKAKRNSTFNLYFYPHGKIDDVDILAVLPVAKFHLNIFNFRHQLVNTISNITTEDEFIMVNLTASDETKLVPGSYSLSLDMEYAVGAPLFNLINDAKLIIE